MLTKNYNVITDTNRFDHLVERFLNTPENPVAFDVETEVHPHLKQRPWQQPLVCVSFATPNQDGTEYVAVVETEKTGLEPFTKLTNHPLIAHNASFEILVFLQQQITLTELRDTMIAESLLNLGTRRWYSSLAVLSQRMLGQTLAGKGETALSFRRGTELTEEQLEYSALDSVVALRIWQQLEKQLTDQNLTEAFNLEMRALPAICELTHTGLPFNWEQWIKQLDEVKKNVIGVASELDDKYNSAVQLSLFSEPDLKDYETREWYPQSGKFWKFLNKQEKTRLTRLYPKRPTDAVLKPTDSVDKTLLKKLSLEGSDLADQLLIFREGFKLLTTYGPDMRKQAAPETGRFHPSYQSGLVATGRLSSSQPNAQNFPRKMSDNIQAPDGRTLVTADYSQVELRVGAALSGDQGALSTFQSGGDIHTSTAAWMFGHDVDQLTRDVKNGDPEAIKVRKKAKSINFGVYYGLGAEALGTLLTINGIPTTRKEASKLIELWYEAFPGVSVWLTDRDDQIAQHATKATETINPTETLRLWNLWVKHKEQMFAHLREHKTYPERDTLPDLGAVDYHWLMKIGERPTLVDHDNKHIGFETRTVANRKRQFVAYTSSWLDSQLKLVFSSKKSEPDRVFQMLADHPATSRAGLVLNRTQIGTQIVWSGEGPNVSFSVPLNQQGKLSRKQAKNSLGTPALKGLLVELIWEVFPTRARWLQNTATRESVRRMANAYRNSPVQGGAAEVCLTALAELWAELREHHPTARLIHTVHDSITVECDTEHTDQVAELVYTTMTAAFHQLWGETPVVVDVETGSSLGSMKDWAPESP